VLAFNVLSTPQLLHVLQVISTIYVDGAKLWGVGEIGAMNSAQQDACQRGVAGSDAAHEKWLRMLPFNYPLCG
jgi:hypothetical protein